MDGFDFSPLFRSTIGFDRLFRPLDATSRVDGAFPGYPPFNQRRYGCRCRFFGRWISR